MAKVDEGTVQYAFDHANNFTLLSVAPKKNKRVVFLSTMHSEKKRDEDTGKEEINVFYNHEKGGVDSQDQMCSLYTTAKKTNRWPMRLFYGIIDSAALNTFVIFTENVPNFGERWPATSWVHYTTSCNTQSSAPEDGQNNCPKDVELTGIINKPLLLHLVGCLYYLYFIIFFLDLLNNLSLVLYRMSRIS